MPADALLPDQKAALAPSDQYIDELEKADEYVLGVAMHNFSIPSVLKLWIDQIVRAGRTFSYGPEGVKGALTGRSDHTTDELLELADGEKLPKATKVSGRFVY